MLSTVDWEITHKNQIEPITFYTRNTFTNDLEDVAYDSSWSLIQIDNDLIIHTGTFGPSGGSEVHHVGTGIYQWHFNSHDHPMEYDLSLRCAMLNEVTSQDIFLKSVSAKYYKYAAYLSGQVDKARKSVSDNIENMDRSTFEPSIQFFFGYALKNYVFYLERGVQYLNAIPPYTGITVQTFPDTQAAILIDAATIAALEAQGLFAIDTDYQYSLGGNSLVIDHYTKLSAHISALLSRFTNTALSWKQQFRTKGTVMFQWSPGGIRSQRLYGALPSSYWSRVMSSTTP